MMNVEYEPETLFAIHLWTFKVIGLWPIDVKNPLLRSAHKFYGFAFLSFFTALYFLMEIINVGRTQRNLKSTVDVFYLLFTHIANAVKLINLIVHVKTVKRMMWEVKQPIFTPKRLEHLTSLKSTAKNIRQDTILLLTLVALSVTVWIFCEFLSNERITEIPLITWLPGNIFDNVTFMYAYQVFCTLMNGFVNILMDTLASGMLTLVSGQLENLKYNLRFLVDDSLTIVKSELSKENVIHYEKLDFSDERILKERLQPLENVLDSPRTRRQFDRILHVRLVECIKHHRAIVKYVEEIKRVFQIGIIAQIISSTIIICLTCFELIVVPITSMVFFHMLLYQACMTYEIFCYCWRGNEITLKTSELVNAAYGCKWLLGSASFRTSLLIMMSRMQRPVKLLMGGFFFLSVTTFFAILKTAYSFLVLLQNLYSRNI